MRERMASSIQLEEVEYRVDNLLSQHSSWSAHHAMPIINIDR
jgi:hypothetical protein